MRQRASLFPIKISRVCEAHYVLSIFCSCCCKHGHVGPLSPSLPSLNSLQSLRVLVERHGAAEECVRLGGSVLERGHKVGLTVKRGVGTVQTGVAEGEQIEEDGEQCVGGLAGTLGGTFKGALGSLPHSRSWSTTRCTISPLTCFHEELGLMKEEKKVPHPCQ